MMKKITTFLSRAIWWTVEAGAILCLIAVLLWGVLVLRLSQGPLNVEFLTHHLEEQIVSEDTGFSLDVGGTYLTWGGRTDPFEIELRDVRVTRTDQTPVLDIKKVGVRLSKRNLIFGRIVPRVIRIYRPFLRVIRQTDSQLTLDIQKDSEDIYGPPVPPHLQPASDHAYQMDFVATLLEDLYSKNKKSTLWGGLRRIAIQNATVYYEDRFFNVHWVSRGTNIALEKEKDRLVLDTGLIFHPVFESAGAPITARAVYDPATKQTAAHISFSRFKLSEMVGLSPKLQHLKGVTLPLKGAMKFVLNEEFKSSPLKFVIASDAGAVNIDNLYKEPLNIEKLFVQGEIDPQKIEGSLNSLAFGIKDGPTVQISARVTTDEKGTKKIAAEGTLKETLMDDLHKYWPEALAPDAQRWVTTNLTAGTADVATLIFKGTYDLNETSSQQAAEEGEGVIPEEVAVETKPTFTIDELHGKIDFRGIKVDYFNPLMPVTEATGVAYYNTEMFDIDVTSAKLQDMTVGASKVKITGLDTQSATTHAMIDIVASVSGPVKTALTLLDGDPLHYIRDMGLSIDGVAGQSDVQVTFKFPLYNDLTMSDVLVTADAKLNDITLNNVVAGLPITGGPMALSFKDSQITVKGTGRLGNAPMEFDWFNNFANNTSGVNAQITADASMLKTFGVPDDLQFMGSIPLTVKYDEGADQSARVALSGDVTGLSFVLPVVEYAKPLGDKGNLNLRLLMQNEKIQKIEGLVLKTDQLSLAGDLSFMPSGEDVKLSSAYFSKFVLGKNDVSIKVDVKKDGFYDIEVLGRQFDASGFFKEDDTSANKDMSKKEAEAKKIIDPVRITMGVDTLLTADNTSITNAKIALIRNQWQRLERLKLNGMTGKYPVSILFDRLPDQEGYGLEMDAENAGLALTALGISKNVIGGKLQVRATQPKNFKNIRDLRGTVFLFNYKIKDAPLIAKLLNAMSVPGMLGLLSGQGLTFKKARVNFNWIDQGPPYSNAIVRKVSLKDGETGGAALGLTFEGNIDLWNDYYDLNGTIVPVSDLNKLLNGIPILGHILTAGGEGFIAFTYTIKGHGGQQVVTVNPLAALAPGVLRKLFFE